MITAHLSSGGTETYSYDGDGNRVLKTAGGTTGSTYWYGADGAVTDEQIRQSQPHHRARRQHPQPVLQRQARLAHGLRRIVLAKHALLQDQIGSSRTTIGLIGGFGSPAPDKALITTTDFYPFGAYVNPPATNLEQEFTGKIRDAETGNDYFGASLPPPWAAS